MLGEFRLGELLVQQGLVSATQLADALARQQRQDERVPLGQILVNQKIVTQRQLESILDAFGKRARLGEVLLRHGAISRQQLDHALAVQKKGRRPLGQTLIELGYVDDAGMRQALATQLGIPYLALDRMTIDRSLNRFINGTYARRRTVVPVAVAGQMLTVCMDDPTQRGVVEELTRSTGKVVTVVTASHESIGRALVRLYEERVEPRPAETLELLSEEKSAPSKSKYAIESALTRVDVLVRQLMSVAISRRVSDIHLEMLSDRLQIRFRVDGVLEYLEPGELGDSCNRSAREVISRLKILGKLDIAERRRPQDGSFRVKVERKGKQRGVDFRVSVLPSHYGESVVLPTSRRRRCCASSSTSAREACASTGAKAAPRATGRAIVAA